MNAEQQLRDAWIAEMWPVCRGVDKPRSPRLRGVCKSCGKPVDITGKKGAPRQYCFACRPARKAA